jgi:hypothetical protein
MKSLEWTPNRRSRALGYEEGKLAPEFPVTFGSVATGSPLVSPAVSQFSSPVTSPAIDPTLAALADQFSLFSLLIKASLDRRLAPPSITNVTPAPALVPVPTAVGSYPPSARPPPRTECVSRCIFCDSVDHLTLQCTDLLTALSAGIVKYNDKGRLAFVSTGDELPLMYGKGGMKRLLPLAPAQVQNVSTSMITVGDTTYGRLGSGGSILRTTLDFDTGERIEKIVDVEVEEKRKWDGPTDGPRPKRQPHPTAKVTESRPTPKPVTVEDVPEETTQQTEPLSSASQVPATHVDPTASGAVKKFRFASDLSKSVTPSQIAEKVMDTPVQLTIREVLAVSSDVFSYLHDQTKKKRVPLADESSATAATSAAVNYEPADVNSTGDKAFYALPSGKAKVTLGGDFQINATLDNGSEVNVIPK